MQYVDVKVHGNIATILMDRAAVRNAINPQLLQDLSTAFSDVHQEKRVRAVVLAGNGEHFCMAWTSVFSRPSRRCPARKPCPSGTRAGNI